STQRLVPDDGVIADDGASGGRFVHADADCTCGNSHHCHGDRAGRDLIILSEPTGFSPSDTRRTKVRLLRTERAMTQLGFVGGSSSRSNSVSSSFCTRRTVRCSGSATSNSLVVLTPSSLNRRAPGSTFCSSDPTSRS